MRCGKNEIAASVDQPVVSVGIPTFNRPEGLRATLACIRNQTYRNLDIIVSDNCSSLPEVGELIQGEAAGDARIRHFKQEKNIGGLANFQFVLKKAKGKYFIWVADDDLCASNFIQSLVDCMERHDDIALCTCDVRSMDENDKILETDHLDSIRPEKDWVTARQLFFRYPTSNIFFAIYGLYRTNVLKDKGIRQTTGWKGAIINAEVPFLATVALHGRIAAIPEVLKTYRRHPDSWYHKEANAYSAFDRFMLRLGIRLKLCRLALGASQPLTVKWSLLSTIIASWISSINVRAMISVLLPEILKKKLRRLCG